jgi:multisubunit Na+/H+ antiporter MnhB subunit
MTFLQQVALFAVVALCALALLFNVKGIRRKLRIRRGTRLVIWSFVGVVVVLFIAAYGLLPQGGEETSGGSARSGSHR